MVTQKDTEDKEVEEGQNEMEEKGVGVTDQKERIELRAEKKMEDRKEEVDMKEQEEVKEFVMEEGERKEKNAENRTVA